MSYWEVKDYLNQLVDFSEGENDLVLSLCRSSLKEIEAGLKSNANRDDIRIIAAAAGLAYYKLMLRRAASQDEEGIASFKAGDVSITQQSKDVQKQLAEAEIFCKKMTEKIIPLCEDNCFAFKHVEVMQ